MPRNASGVYSLPGGNPVVTNTLISSTWANTTLSDVANEVTNSLDRNGRGSMLAPFKNVDGTSALPGMTYGNEPSLGFFRRGAGQIGISVGGLDTGYFAADGLHANLIGTVNSGVYAAAADAVGAPGHTWVGDLTTGMWRPAASTIAFAIAGTEQMRISNAGVISMLQGSAVLGSNIGANNALITMNAAAAAGYFGLVGTAGAIVNGSAVGDMVYRVGTKRHMFSVDNGGTASLLLDASGQVGIGGATTLISRLDVTATAGALAIAVRGRAADNIGTFEFFNNAGSTRYGYIQGKANTLEFSADGASGIMTFLTNGTTRATLSAAGDFSLTSAAAGTTRGITISNTSAAAGSSAVLAMGVNGGVAADPYILFDISGVVDWAIGVDNSDSDAFVLSLSSTLGSSNKLRIDTSGVITDANGNELGYKGLPAASVTTGAFVAADRGKCVFATAGVTVPNATMAAGDVVVIQNTTNAAITITASITTLRQTGTANTGNRTLAAYGRCAILFQSNVLGFISGDIT